MQESLCLLLCGCNIYNYWRDRTDSGLCESFSTRTANYWRSSKWCTNCKHRCAAVLVSVAKKNKPATMLSSNVQSIDLPMDCMAWRFWTMKQSIGCSKPTPRSSAAKQWVFTTPSNDEEAHTQPCHIKKRNGSYSGAWKSQVNQASRNRTVWKYGSENRLNIHNCFNTFLWFSPDRTIWKNSPHH